MNRKITIWKRFFLLCFLSLTATSAMAEEKNMYIPLGEYEYVTLESRTVQSPSLGAMVIGEDFLISGIYKYGSFIDESPQGYPGHYHSIDTMFETHWGKHQVLSSFKTESDEPFTGGWATLQATGIYNYQVMKGKKLNVRLGLGASLGDFGIDLDNGKNWPLIPVPYLGMEYRSRIIQADFSFVFGPNLSLTIFPERKIRFTGEAEINNYRDLQDLIFTTSVHYRFFSGADSSNDFAGVAVGITNTGFGFTPGGGDEPYEIQYYSVFSELDLTLLKISGGYCFNGQERLGKASPEDLGNGYFMNIQAMYQF